MMPGRLGILLGALAAATAAAEGISHGGSRDDDLRMADPGSSGAPAVTVLNENSEPGHKAGDGDPQRSSAKTTTASPDSAPAGGFPLFILADGPNQAGEAHPSPAAASTDRLVRIIAHKIPSARILRVPLSLPVLRDAWLAHRKELLHGETISSALLIINARAEARGETYALIAREGVRDERALIEATRALAESLRTDSSSADGTSLRLNLALLTADAGNVNCRLHPGPIFGMAPRGMPRDGEAWEAFLNYHGDHPSAPFPTNARDWFDSWQIAVGKRAFFYCPTSNLSGFLGTMGVKAAEAADQVPLRPVAGSVTDW